MTLFFTFFLLTIPQVAWAASYNSEPSLINAYTRLVILAQPIYLLLLFEKANFTLRSMAFTSVTIPFLNLTQFMEKISLGRTLTILTMLSLVFIAIEISNSKRRQSLLVFLAIPHYLLLCFYLFYKIFPY